MTTQELEAEILALKVKVTQLETELAKKNLVQWVPPVNQKVERWGDGGIDSWF